jgi:hypothetical protein
MFRYYKEAVQKVKFLFCELSFCNHAIILLLQTSPKEEALKSPSGDLGVLAAQILTKCNLRKTIKYF